MRHRTLDLPFSGANLSTLAKLLGVSSSNILAEWYAGNSVNGDLLDMSGNGRDLADSGGPTITNSSLLHVDHNQLQAFNCTGSSYHSASHSSWMNIYTSDFTISALVRSPASNPGNAIYFFCHGIYGEGGALCFIDSSGRYGIALGKTSSSPALVRSTTGYSDGRWHLVHYVRKNDYGYVYVDGVFSENSSAPVPVSGYGLDLSVNLYVGCSGGADGLTPGLYWTSPISYIRIQNTALSYARIRRELMLFQGIVGGKSAGHYVRPTFIRSAGTNITGVSYAPRTTGDKSLVTVPADWPVKTNDGAVLLHAQTRNYLLQTQAFNTTPWTKLNLGGGTDVVNTAVAAPLAPDGTQTVCGIAGSNVDVVHGVTQAATITAAGYAFTIYAYKGNKDWLYLSNNTLSCSAYFNISSGYVGTVAGTGCTAEIQKDPLPGWYRCAIYFTGTAAAHTVQISPANADGDADFAGDGSTSNVFVWQSDLVPEKHFCLPISVGASAITRAGDFLTYVPWLITKDCHKYINPLFPNRITKSFDAAITGATPTIKFTGNESLAGPMVTPTTGTTYLFTKDGTPYNGYSDAEGGYFNFNGTSDGMYVKSAAALNPAGDFSIVAVWTPATVVAGSQMIMSKQGNSGDRGWYLAQSGTAVVFGRSADGTNTVSCTLSSCLEVGKTVFICATFQTSRGMILRVNEFLPVTESTTTATYATTARLALGHNSYVPPSTGNYAAGKLSYASFFNAYAVTDAEYTDALNLWRIAKINPANTVTPGLLFNGNETIGGTSVTPTIGSYTFTTSGGPKNDWTEEEGDHFRFTGSVTPDYFYVDSSDFNPAGKFSMIATYTPLTATGNLVIASKWNATGNQRGWQLYQSNATMNFTITTDGITSVTAQTTACIDVGKPMMITAAYDPASGPTLRVDSYQGNSQTSSGRVHQSTANLLIGALSGPANYLNGKLHYYAFINGYFINATDHDAMYASWKREGFLPLYMSPTTPKKKLHVEVEMKALFPNGSSTNSNRTSLVLGGATGSAGSTRNMVGLFTFYTNNAMPGFLNYENIGGTTRSVSCSAGDVVYNKWNKYYAVLDCTNLATCTFEVNGVSQFDTPNNMSGTFTVWLKDALLRLGVASNSAPYNYCEFRNLKIWTE